MKGLVIESKARVCTKKKLPVIGRSGGIKFQKRVSKKKLKKMDIEAFLKLVPEAVASTLPGRSDKPREELENLISIGRGRPITSHSFERVQTKINAHLKGEKFDGRYYWVARCKVDGTPYFQLWIVDWEHKK